MPITAMTHSIAELKTLMHSPSNVHDNVPLAHGLAAQSVPLDTGGSVDHISSCDDAATPFVATASLKGAVTVWESHNATPLSKVLAFDTTKPDTFAVASGVTDAASLVGARVVAAAVLPSFTSSAKRAEAAKAIAEARAERTPQATKAEPQLPDSYYEIMLTMQTVQAHGRASDDDVWSSWAVRDIEVKVKGSSPFVGAEVRWRPVVQVVVCLVKCSRPSFLPSLPACSQGYIQSCVAPDLPAVYVYMRSLGGLTDMVQLSDLEPVPPSVKNEACRILKGTTITRTHKATLCFEPACASLWIWMALQDPTRALW